MTGQVGARLRHQGPQGERFVLLDRYDRRRQGDLGTSLDQHDQLPTIDRDLDLVHLATLVRDPPLASDLTTALIRGGGLQVGGIDDACDLGSKYPSLSQGTDDVVKHGFQVAHVQLHDVIGQRLRADGPRGARPRALGGTPLTHPMPHLLGIEAHQAHEGLITEEQGRQRMHALDP
jgi:hypothetical protein